jgi:hypothetical protein
MKKLAVTLLLSSILMVQGQGWSQKRIKGNSAMTSQTRNTSEYDKIIVTGSFTVEFVKGNEGKIILEGEENIINEIETNVNGDELKIGFKNKKSYSYNSEIKITIPFEKISGISFTGSGDFSTKDEIIAENFELNLTGSGDGKIELDAKNVKISLTGSGDINVTGKTEELEAKVTGSGDLDCFSLVAQNTNCAVSGSGDLKVNSKKSLKARVSGSGDIIYKGKPESLDKKVSGSGDINGF